MAATNKLLMVIGAAIVVVALMMVGNTVTEHKHTDATLHKQYLNLVRDYDRVVKAYNQARTALSSKEEQHLSAQVVSIASDKKQNGLPGPDAVTKLVVDSDFSKLVALDCLGMIEPSSPKTYVMVEPEPLPKWVWDDSERTAMKRGLEDKEARKKSFHRIFDEHLWGDEVHRSGGGSKIASTQNTIQILKAITQLIREWEGMAVKGKDGDIIYRGRALTMVDVPCGDMIWMPEFLKTQQGHIEYTGLDIVGPLIEQHKQKHPAHTFHEWDIVDKPLPKAYDLVFSRHMLQHLTTADALKVLKHFKDSGSKYLLTTTFPDWSKNVELNTDMWVRVRKSNLMIEPYPLGKPICWHQDHSFSFLALWKLND